MRLAFDLDSFGKSLLRIKRADSVSSVALIRQGRTRARHERGPASDESDEADEHVEAGEAADSRVALDHDLPGIRGRAGSSRADGATIAFLQAWPPRSPADADGDLRT